ncbi:M20/M25/M40 family metallo-hydrolase [Clostridium vincentii]|uniref:Succinyl-diaminopimelate desuccinylase n=1 Tax=Clostridium vincentii TaxID=52704 RepID=A0A2T0BAZ9_9CLOT|nr:M20/M25/M40 family metallo-hydrolase [Clostridium vincentii]PRR81054.1 Succinyl-diaminopimelate desuccinylase [Clostridium vincentii]
MIIKMICVFGIAFLIAFTVVIVKTIIFKSKQLQNIKQSEFVNLDRATVIEHLSKILQYNTVSNQDSSLVQNNEFLDLQAYIKTAFPLMHTILKRDVFSDYTLFYTWEGKNKVLEPILFSGHLDVVPAIEEAETQWKHPPFSGHIDNEYIWGRGTLDNKGPVISIIESIEQLLKEGFKPDRTICFVFTHDEEIGGPNGASEIAKMFELNNLKFNYILDEGGTITNGIFPGISKSVAMIGIAEKGAVNIELTVNQIGGTSAIPPQNTTIGILSEAISKLEKNQCSTMINGATKQMFDYIGREMKFLNKSLFANQWIFSGMLKRRMSKSQTTIALLRTTTATTMFNGGIKVNVLPSEAKAVISFRIIQGHSVKAILRHIEKTISDSRVKVKITGYSVEPSPISSVDSQEFKAIQKSINEVFSDIIVTPYLWTGATNSKHFVKFTNNIYRFSPLYIDKKNSQSIHGVNEKISIDNLLKCIEFYRTLIINSTK